MQNFERYAVYFVPEINTQLAALGNQWLGQDPATGMKLQVPQVGNIPVDVYSQIIETPARYGFHATLKAPFRLKALYQVEDLDGVLTDLSSKMAIPMAGPLQLKEFSNFFALKPTGDCTQINAIAMRCVEQLDYFRAEPVSFELARRRKSNLSKLQDEYLVKWGYPYVMDEFRFHLTLSGNVPDVYRPAFRQAIESYWAPAMRMPFTFNQISLVGDPGGGLPFKLLKRYNLEKAHASAE